MGPRPAHHAARARRGGVYVLVLLAIIACSAMLVGALDLVRARQQLATHSSDYLQANANAAAGLEMALYQIESTPDWRWGLGDGAWFTDIAMPDGGTVSVEVTGDGATLTNAAADPAVITAIGTHGATRAIYSQKVSLQQGDGPALIAAPLGAYGVLAYWPLDGSGSSWASEVISDTKGTTQEFGAGTTHAGALPGPGVITGPWFHDSSSLRLGDAGNLDNVRTISFWFYGVSSGSTQVIIERSDTLTLPGEWGCWVRDDQLVARYIGVSGQTVTTRAPVSAGVWHHVVIVAEDWRVVLYLDGVAVDVGAMARTNYWVGAGSIPVRVAGRYSGVRGFEYPFTGSLCELLLMEGAMSGDDVAALYAAYPPAGQYRVITDSYSRGVR